MSSLYCERCRNAFVSLPSLLYPPFIFCGIQLFILNDFSCKLICCQGNRLYTIVAYSYQIIESSVVRNGFAVSVREFAITIMPVLFVSIAKGECKVDYDQMGMSDKAADG